MKGRYFICAMLASAWVASAAERASEHYTLSPETMHAGGTGYSLHYANRGSVGDSGGISAATVPDGPQVIAYQGFVAQLEPPLFATADLAVTVEPSAASVLVDSPMSYSIVVRNNGPDAAPNVSVRTTLPWNMSFDGAWSSQGTQAHAGGVVTSALGTLDASASATIKIDVTARQKGLASFNTAAVGEAIDPNPDDNIRVISTPVTLDVLWRGLEGSWFSAENWLPAIVPALYDNAIIGSGRVIVDADWTVGSLYFGGGTIAGPGRLTLARTGTWSAGPLNAPLLVGPQAVFNITGTLSKVLSGALTNSGVVVWDGGGNLTIASTFFVNQPGALWDIRCDAQAGGYDMQLVNYGTIAKTAGTGLTTIAPGGNGWFANYGALQGNAGTLRIQGNNLGSISSNNEIFAADGATVAFGAYTRFNDTTFHGPGPKQIQGGGAISGLIRATNLTYAGLGTAVLFNDTVGHATILGALDWTSGELRANIVIPTGSQLNITGPLSKVWQWGALSNSGVVLWDAGADLTIANADFVNEPGGLWDIRSDAQVSGYDMRLANYGTIAKTAGTGLTTIAPGGNGWFANYRLVRADTGSLRVQGNNLGSISSNNEIFAADGATVAFGAYTRFNDTTFHGPGPKQIQGGGAISGLIRATNLTYAGSTSVLYNDGAGHATLLGTLNWVSGELRAEMQIPIGSQLNITGSLPKVLSGALTNSGVVVWDSGTNLTIASTFFVNQPGGLWDIRCDAQASGYDMQLANYGTIAKTAGTGVTTIAPGGNGWFANYGAMEVIMGTVALSGPYSPAPSSKHTFRIGGAVPRTAFGKLTVSGTANLTGTLELALSNGFKPTTNDSFRIITAALRSGTFTRVIGRGIGEGRYFDPTYQADGVLLTVRTGQPNIAANFLSYTNGQFTLRLVGGEPGVTYVIEAATESNPGVNWVPVSTNQFTGEFLEFRYPDASQYPQRFYRALIP